LGAAVGRERRRGAGAQDHQDPPQGLLPHVPSCPARYYLKV